MPSRAVLAVALGLAAAACGGRAASAPRAAPIGNQLAPDAPPTRAAVSLRGALAMMPANTEVVLELDAVQLRESALWKLIEAPLRNAGSEKLAEVGRVCGFDPLASIDSVLFGSRGTESDVIFVVRGLPQRALFDCAARMGAAHGTKVRRDGELLEVTRGDEVTVRLRYVDDTTLITGFAADVPLTADELARMAAAGPGEGLMSSPAFAAELARVDPAATAWWILNGTYAPLQGIGTKLRAIRGEIRAGAEPARAVALSMVVHAEDTNGAQQMDGVARIGIDQLRTTPLAELAQAITVDTHDTEVQLDARLDLPQVQRLVALMRGLAGTP